MISRVAPEASFTRSALSLKYDPSPSQADIQMTKTIDAPRHFRARPHHRRQERTCELQRNEADLGE
jgi:hypothetical protein